MGIMSKMMVKTVKKKAVGATKEFATTTLTNFAVKSISGMLGVPDGLTDRILEAGIPSMIFAGADDPSITERLFGSSKNRKKRNRKESERHFFDIFGDTGRRMNKNIATDTGADEDQVNGVMGLFMDTLEGVIAGEEPEDAGMLHKMFKKDAEYLEKSSPGLARKAMDIIF